MTFHVAMLLFPRATQLDFTGPHEVFARMPDARVSVVWKDRAPFDAGSPHTAPPALVASVRDEMAGFLARRRAATEAAARNLSGEASA
jgi:putative intracellular protease/amidase